jgi:hypothetical protein
VGPVRMDVDRHVVTVGGDPVQLPLKEFELLELLLRNAGRVLTRGQLIDRVWGADYVGDTKTLDVHVKRLRSKIEPDPSSPGRSTPPRTASRSPSRARSVFPVPWTPIRLSPLFPLRSLSSFRHLRAVRCDRFSGKRVRTRSEPGKPAPREPVRRAPAPRAPSAPGGTRLRQEGVSGEP